MATARTDSGLDVSSMTGRDPVSDFETITRELALFPGRDAAGERLQDKPVVVAANKIAALDEPERLERLRAHLQHAGIPLYPVSAATGAGSLTGGVAAAGATA